ncbi:MAG: hypothetical protein MJ014_00230 [Methanocorpusculum sp.]|nr:hypothetical protein [Methanocorpusculum sp.]
MVTYGRRSSRRAADASGRTGSVSERGKKMSLFGRKEKEEIVRLKKRLADKCDRLDCERKIIMDQYRKITELEAKKKVLTEQKDMDVEMLRQIIIYKNKKIEELIKSKNKLRKENVRLEDRVEELQQELLNERERADRYADACSASMEYGWEKVPEEEMEKAGFTRTETGWRA